MREKIISVTVVYPDNMEELKRRKARAEARIVRNRLTCEQIDLLLKRFEET
jgi:hypothetical protein